MLKVYKIFRLVVTFAVLAVVMTIIHELWHHLAAIMVGASVTTPQICMQGFWLGQCAFDPVGIDSIWEQRVIYGAGGVGSAIVPFGVLWLFARLSPTQWDMGIEFSAGVLAAVQLGAGLAEGTAALDPSYQAISLAIISMCAFPVIIYEGLRWGRWLVDDAAT